MLDDISHSEPKPVQGTQGPEQNGDSQHAPESDLSYEEILEELSQIQAVDNLGRVADREVTVGIDTHADSADLMGLLEIPTAYEPRLEFGEMTPETARMIATEVVGKAYDINSMLHERRANEPRGLADIEPASPLLLAGKLLAAMDHLQTSTERGRDQYRHADEVVSMLGIAWRKRFGDVGAEALDELRFLAYVHNISKGIGDNLVIKSVIEELEKSHPNLNTYMITEAHKQFTQVPEPEVLSKTYNDDISEGIQEGGIRFIMVKFACVQDMLWLEENSPLKLPGHNADAIDQRKYAKNQLSWAAEDIFLLAPMFFGSLPHGMEMLTPEDIENARRFEKSNFGLWEAAGDVRHNILAQMGE